MENRISIIVNGLSDIDPDVKEYCKEYLTSVICAKKDEKPEKVREQSAGLFQRKKRVYRQDQLIPILQTLKPISLSSSHNHSQISLVIYLLMRDIIFPTYGTESVFDAIENIVQKIDLKIS